MAKESWFDSQQVQEIFLFSTMSRPVMEPTQPPSYPLRIGKLLRHEIAHLPPFSAEVKNTWVYTSTVLYVFMVWYLIKHMDSFMFTSVLLL
jgi:hypothetical protein